MFELLPVPSFWWPASGFFLLPDIVLASSVLGASFVVWSPDELAEFWPGSLFVFVARFHSVLTR